MVLSLDHLPEEILHSILCYSHPVSCAALAQTSRRFQNVTNEPLLWRLYCQTHYKFWDRKHGVQQKIASSVSTVDWRSLFVLRYQVDCSVTALLNSILASQTGRIEKFRAVIDLGYDAKDTLLRHSEVEEGEDCLARRWAGPFPWPSCSRVNTAFGPTKVLCPSTSDLPPSEHCNSRVGQAPTW